MWEIQNNQFIDLEVEKRTFDYVQNTNKLFEVEVLNTNYRSVVKI